MCNYPPASEIDSIDFINGKCLIKHNRESALLIINPEDVCHIGFMLYHGQQFVCRHLGEKSMFLSVPSETMTKIKALANQS